MRLYFNNFDKKDWLVFLIGIFMVVRIQIIGTFTIAEILLLLSYLGISYNCWLDKNVRRLVILALLWTIGTVIANVVNNVETIDFVKGVFFKILFIFIIPPIYSLLYDKPERILLFYLGMGISGIWAPDFAQTEGVAEMWSLGVYRFYAYSALVASIAYVLYFRNKKKLAIFIMEVTSIVGLYQSSRNLFLTTSIAAVLLLVLNRNRGYKEGKVAYFQKKISTYMIVGLLSVFAVDFAYENLAANGVLGRDAYYKYIEQTSEGNILEGGRGAFFMGIELIKMKPITGWGSYAKDTWGFKASYAAKHNKTYHESSGDDDWLPGHSYIVGSWMSSGIFGGLFWLYVLFLLWKIFKSGCLMCEPRILGLIMFQLTALLWAIFFSPFGERVQVLFLILTMSIIYSHYKNGVYKKISKI